METDKEEISNEKLFKEIENMTGFSKHNNFKFVEIKEKSAIIRADLTENSMNPYKIAHGGLIFGLGDMAMGMATKSTGRNAVTLSANITYLKPAVGEYLLAKAEVIKNGKTTAYVRCDIYNDKDVQVATMDSNYYYIS